MIIECDRRNIALFQRTFPSIRCIPRTVREIEPGRHAWDYRAERTRLAPARYIMAASLPALFGAGMGRPAVKGGYLRVDPGESAAWRAWLASLGSRPKVGLCWRSGLVDAVRADFYFAPSMLLKGIGHPAVSYVSLMYVDATDATDTLRETLGTVIHQPPGLYQRDELDRLAALISELDVVVTVDTSVCSMAASCGVRTIRLEASYLMLANGRDAFFDNL